MIPTVARVNVPFRWSIADGLQGQSMIARSYGREIAAVISRPSRKWVPDRNGLLVPYNLGSVAVGVFGGEPAALFEDARTNLVASSEDASSWSNDGVTVSTNFLTAPTGLATMDLLTPSGLNSHARFIPITFTGDGTKCASVFTALVGSLNSAVSIYDATAGVHRHYVRISWATGVPVLTTFSGAGTRFTVEGPFAGNTYRISFSADGVIAANSNFLYCYPDDIAGTFAAPFWGAQAENASVPSSYIQTTGSTVTRSDDSCYFDVPALNPPRASTFYVRFVERGTRFRARMLFGISSSGGAETILRANSFTNGRYQFQRGQGGSNYTAAINNDAAQPALGDIAEFRGAQAADGSLASSISVNGAAETTGSAAGIALPTAYSAARIYLNSQGASGSIGQNAFTHLVVAEGVQTMATMRELAGV